MAFHLRTTGDPETSLASAERRPARSALLDLVDGALFDGPAAELVDIIVAWTRQERFRVAVGASAHTLNLASGDAGFAAQLRAADLCYCDGQSVVWAARLLGVPVAERTATTDLAPLLVERAAREGLRLYFLGAADGVAEAAADRMRAAYPGVQIRAHHGYLDAATTRHVLADIAAWRTDVLLIGLGDPLQLAWLDAHRRDLGEITALTSGGLFDWLSERHRRAPRWMIRLGLEWLHRLIIEPRRLGRRYLVGNPVFLLRVARAITQRRLRPALAFSSPEAPLVGKAARPTVKL